MTIMSAEIHFLSDDLLLSRDNSLYRQLSFSPSVSIQKIICAFVAKLSRKMIKGVPWRQLVYKLIRVNAPKKREGKASATVRQTMSRNNIIN
jgi:hypothetical protein